MVSERSLGDIQTRLASTVLSLRGPAIVDRFLPRVITPFPDAIEVAIHYTAAITSRTGDLQMEHGELRVSIGQDNAIEAVLLPAHGRPIVFAADETISAPRFLRRLLGRMVGRR